MKFLVSIALVALMGAAVSASAFGAVPGEVAPPTPPGPDDPADVAALQHATGLRARQDAKGNASEIWLSQEPDSEALAHLAALRNVRELRVERIEDAGAADKALAVAASCPWWPAVEILSLNRSKVSADGLRVLRGLRSIRKLSLWSTGITTDGLAHVARLRGLESLGLGGNRLTTEGVKHLAGLRNLEDLDLGETDLTDGAVAHLAGLTRLKRLDLGFNAITDAAMPHLKGLTGLEYLSLANTLVTGRGMEALRGLTDLWQLSVEGCGIADDEWPEDDGRRYAGLAIIGLERRGYRRAADERAAVAALRRANHCVLLFSTNGRLFGVDAVEPYSDVFTDSIFDRLASLPELGSLRMERCGSVTPAGLKRLAGLPRLESLGIVDCKAFTARQLRSVLALKHIRSLEYTLDWEEGEDRNGEEVLSVLAGIKGLRELSIGRLIADDLKHIGRLHDLESLTLQADLGVAAALEDAFANLSGLTNLRTLDLNNVSYSAGLVQVAGGGIADGPRTVGGLKWVEPLTKLEYLRLPHGFPMEESELVHLRGMTELRELPPVREIADGDIKYLEGMTHLETLSLAGTNITAAGYERLRKALPGTIIGWAPPGEPGRTRFPR